MKKINSFLQQVEPLFTKSLLLKFVIVFITMLMLGSPLYAQVTLLGTPSSVSGTNTLTFTLPPGNAREIIVTVSDALSTNITSVMVGTNALVEIVDHNNGTGTDAIYYASFGSHNISSIQTIVVQSTSANHAAKVITVHTYANVNGFNPITNIQHIDNTISPSNSTLNIISAPGNMVFDLFDTYTPTLTGAHTAGSGQSVTTNVAGLTIPSPGNGFGYYTTSEKPGAALVSMSRSTTNHQALIHIAFNINETTCIPPITYSFTGGGSYCILNAGVPIGLTGSQVGVNYQLYQNGNPIGLPIAGTGSPISFSIQPAGTYTVIGTKVVGACAIAMNGNVVVVATPSTSNTTNATGCGSYFWPVNNTFYISGGTYNSITGCHVEILNLTITTPPVCQNGGIVNTPTCSCICPSGYYGNLCQYAVCATTYGSSNVSACVSYFWNSNTNTSSGAYLDTFMNAGGCDSIHTLNLTINPLPVVTAPNVSGCPSIPINLGGSPTGGTWSLSNPYLGTSTSYTYYYTDGNGCSNSASGTINASSAIINSLTLTNVTGISAQVNWTSGSGIAWYEVRYKKASSSLWTTGTNGNSTIKNLLNLESNTLYEVQVRTFCSSSNPGPWSASSFFTTNNICSTPATQNVTNVSGTTAVLNWSASPGLNSYPGYYMVRWKPTSSSIWSTATTIATSKSIAGLSLSTNYEFQVRSFCGSSNSAYSNSTFFITAASREINLEIINTEYQAETIIYPNPVRDYLTLKMTASESDIRTIKIIDIAGWVLQEVNTIVDIGINEINLPMNLFANGLYVVRISNEKQVLENIKFRKE